MGARALSLLSVALLASAIVRAAPVGPILPSGPDDDRVIADATIIEALDRRIREASAGAVVDLAQVPAEMAGGEVRALLTGWGLRGRVPWRDGRVVPEPVLDALRDRRAVDAVPERVPVRRGVVLRLSSLRLWPAAEGLFESPDDREFDLLQATTLAPGEPAVLLHPSRDGRWWFVRSMLCDGWLPAADVAEVDPKDWARLLGPEDFVVVTAPLVTLRGPGGESLRLPMGTRLPLSTGVSARGTGRQGLRVLLPRARPSGPAAFEPVRLPARADVSRGYLPWTRSTVRRLALRHLGRPYGWGSAGGRVDCSGLLVAVYRCVGVFLPRNSGIQAAMPGATDLASLAPNGRLEAVGRLPPGSLLHLPGHVLLVLGRDRQGPVVLHALAARGERAPATGEVRRVPVMRVVAGDLSLVRSTGVTLLESLTSAHDLEFLARSVVASPGLPPSAHGATMRHPDSGGYGW